MTADEQVAHVVSRILATHFAASQTPTLIMAKVYSQLNANKKSIRLTVTDTDYRESLNEAETSIEGQQTPSGILSYGE